MNKYGSYFLGIAVGAWMVGIVDHPASAVLTFWCALAVSLVLTLCRLCYLWGRRDKAGEG